MDLVEIAEVDEALRIHGARYVERLCTPAEAAYATREGRPDPVRLAHCLAAKEAARKALGAGDEGIGPQAIELCAGPGARPEIALHGRAAELAAEAGLGALRVSLAQVSSEALAVVIAQVP